MHNCSENRLIKACDLNTVTHAYRGTYSFPKSCVFEIIIELRKVKYSATAETTAKH